jgi:hypothetical protein
MGITKALIGKTQIIIAKKPKIQGKPKGKNLNLHCSIGYN